MVAARIGPATLADIEYFNRTLRSFVPPNAFDAHGHIYDPKFTAGVAGEYVPEGETALSRRAYDLMVGAWMGDRLPTGALFFPFPAAGADVAAQNRYLADELRSDPKSRGLLLATPDDDPAEMERLLLDDPTVWRGFKPYHVYARDSVTGAPASPSLDADCDDFVPEWVWELSNSYGLAIMLHIVKSRALSDERNIRYVRERCLRYPNARLVLAHSGRGFNPRHTVEGVGALRGLDNVYFDTSAVCEPAAHEAILRTFGPTRLMFGLDHPVSAIRGRSVGLADGFFWTNEAQLDWENRLFGTPTLIGIENLLSLQQACLTMDVNDRDLELIFGGSARAMLGLPPVRPTVDVQAQYRNAKTLIPGGTQLLSKRPELYAPDQWPAYYDEARGCEVIDTQGRRFVDMSTGGILACILGYSDPDVNAAVIRQVRHGSMATLQSHDEVELARKLIEIHPWAAMARFARTGGESMAVAVRTARAFTGRDHVAVCGYHGWHDWYLAANLRTQGDGAPSTDRLAGHLLPGLEPKGVPTSLAGLTRTFNYNRLDEFDAVLSSVGHDLAAVVMEPTRGTDPEPSFLEGIRERCSRNGTLLIFDEISIGWRLCLGGAHLKFGVNPDIAVFAKAISNGFALGAIIGTRPVMEALESTFVSSAYWTEAVGPAAGLAAVSKMQRIDVPAHLGHVGRLVMDGWKQLAEQHRLPLRPTGRPESAVLTIDHPEAAALQTLITVRLLERGFLASSTFNAMLAHEPRHVDAYLAALDEVCYELRQATVDTTEGLCRRIGGSVRQAGFARLVD